jgi:hypothetical protein
MEGSLLHEPEVQFSRQRDLLIIRGGGTRLNVSPQFLSKDSKLDLRQERGNVHDNEAQTIARLRLHSAHTGKQPTQRFNEKPQRKTAIAQLAAKWQDCASRRTIEIGRIIAGLAFRVHNPSMWQQLLLISVEPEFSLRSL